jgi:large subunit ribosomal protein L28
LYCRANGAESNTLIENRRDNPMARECEVCGKGAQIGNQVTTRGKKKYLGGVGTKVTGITRRKFKPNLQRVNATTPKGNKAILVCTQCLKSGAVTKVVRAAPFKLSEKPAKAS